MGSPVPSGAATSYVEGLKPALKTLRKAAPVTQSTDDQTPQGSPDEAPAPHANPDVPGATPDRPISEAARRALLEAAQRQAAQVADERPVEHGGPRGKEPTRYGDWEKKGLAVDF